ncbi:MAG: SAM-dependent methyltransferase, partial [Gammaproteobacteria bacterium]
MTYQALDVTAGGRMAWIDKHDQRAVFVDRRVETLRMKDASVKNGIRVLEVRPNVQADFTALPFPSDCFPLVLFDPPHLRSAGPKSWLRAKYGVLEGDWPAMLRAGFLECFRVLAPAGTLVFKWNEYQIPLSKILPLAPVPPLFGHRSGRHSKTHWLVFTKPNSRLHPTAR